KYFVELRKQVKKGIEEGKELADIKKSIDMPWYKEWTTVNPAEPNIEHVYKELTGLVSPPYPELEPFGPGGPSPTKNTPGRTKPRKVIVASGLMPARLAELKRVAPEIEFLPARSVAQATALAPEADGVIVHAAPAVIKAGKKLRWVQTTTEPTPELLQALEG